MDPVPALDELVWLFETEPTGRVPDEDWRREWPYGAVTFKTTRRTVDVTFYLEPASNLAGLAIDFDSKGRVRLDLDHVNEVRVERLHGAEDLVILFGGAAPAAPLRLTLKPTVGLSWGNSENWTPAGR